MTIGFGRSKHWFVMLALWCAWGCTSSEAAGVTGPERPLMLEAAAPATPGADGEEEPDAQPQQRPAWSSSSRIYPASRCTDRTTREAILEARWQWRRDGAVHHTDRRWFNHTDVEFMETADGGLELQFSERRGSTGNSTRTTEWTRRCQMCGDIIDCEGALTTVRLRQRWIDFDAPVPSDDGALFIVRHGHEIELRFLVDPQAEDRGEVEIKWRALGGDAVTEGKGHFVAGPRTGYLARQVEVSIEGGPDAIEFMLRPDGEWSTIGDTGYGFPVRSTLIDERRIHDPL